ncbi:unnamed protein product [Heligmosomoides polygyrus]|uniref:Peptidase A2 domain-containing protein n=1 Tax=Heligmosomoides polygyrus TaxID=6339 RepID=A0A183GQS3_HELPZ|nr:unnamed protein product [Heligmosomoides polygyrus]
MSDDSLTPEELDAMQLDDSRTESGVRFSTEFEKGLSSLDFDTIDPRILLEYANRRVREQSEGTTFVGHRPALTIFETLPREVREGTFDEIVEAMKKHMSIDSNSERVKALADLRKLAIRDGQTVAEFCLVVERLFNKAYPDTPHEVTSLQKAEILCRQLSGWDGSYCLTEALETSASDEACKKVKEVALRLERSIRMARECRNEGNQMPTGRYSGRYARLSGSRFTGSDSETTQNGKWQDNPSRSEEVVRPRRASGNTQLDNRAKEKEFRPCLSVASQVTLHVNVVAVRLRHRSQASRIGYDCRECMRPWWKSGYTTETSQEIIEADLFGERPTASITICGVEATALLDTGSQTTIIPVKLLKRAIEAGEDLDKYIERLPYPDVRVRDASGNEITFLDTIRVAIKLGEDQQYIAVYVGKSSEEVVVLGTNALQAFNMRLEKCVKETASQVNGLDVMRDEEQARVKRRVFIPSGGIQTLTVSCATSLKVPVLCSSNPLTDGICSASDENEVHIPVLNNTKQGMVFKEGDVIAHPREASTDSYSKKAMVEYFRALVDYVKAEIVLPPFVESSSGRVRSYFKARKEAGELPIAGGWRTSAVGKLVEDVEDTMVDIDERYYWN